MSNTVRTLDIGSILYEVVGTTLKEHKLMSKKLDTSDSNFCIVSVLSDLTSTYPDESKIAKVHLNCTSFSVDPKHSSYPIHLHVNKDKADQIRRENIMKNYKILLDDVTKATISLNQFVETKMKDLVLST